MQDFRVRKPESPTQDAILEFIRDYKVANDGNSPSYTQIARALNKKPSHIYDKVQRLATRHLVIIDESGKILLGGQYIPPE